MLLTPVDILQQAHNNRTGEVRVRQVNCCEKVGDILKNGAKFLGYEIHFSAMYIPHSHHQLAQLKVKYDPFMTDELKLKQGALLDKPDTSKATKETVTEYLRFGSSAMQGWRVEMEDKHTIVADLKELQGLLAGHSFVAVYDGHGGNFSSTYAEDRMLGLVNKIFIERKIITLELLLLACNMWWRRSIYVQKL